MKELEKVCANERLQNEELRCALQNHKLRQTRWPSEKIRKKIKYYTGFSYDQLKMILNNNYRQVTLLRLQKSITVLSLEQQFLLVMIKLVLLICP